MELSAVDKMRRTPSKIDFLEWVAVGALFLAAIALSLIRIDMTDTPWHLATARYAFTEGHWPIHNTFSYTYPDYPLYQQYPIYQTLLYLIYKVGGWEGLSLLHCGMWTAIFFLWITWSGSIRRKMFSLVWMLGLLGLQRRMILRPDILSTLLLVIMLYVIDRYRAERTWVASLLVVIQWLLVNSHQLFPLGLAVQGALLCHLAVVRTFAGTYGISPRDKGVPLLPIVLAFVGSLLVCFLSPLGTDILYVTYHTAASLHYHGKEVQEFMPFYQSRYDSILVACSTVLMIVGVFRRRKWQPFELFLWLIGVAVLAVAIRGVALYVLVCVGISGRNLMAEGGSGASSAKETGSERGEIMFRVFCAMVTLFICGGLLYVRWVSPQRSLGGTQPGIGLALGVWPYPAIKFLKQNPPPGRMINVTWYSGNPLIFELFPKHRVFVDPRFESYPRHFLLKAIEAERNGAVLQELISQYQPDWMVAEVRDPSVRKVVVGFVKEGSWELVHADTVFLILVRNVPNNSVYLAEHRLKPEAIKPLDFLIFEADLLALQQVRMAELYRDFGLGTRAEEMIRAARPAARRYRQVREAIERFKVVPDGLKHTSYKK